MQQLDATPDEVLAAARVDRADRLPLTLSVVTVVAAVASAAANQVSGSLWASAALLAMLGALGLVWFGVFLWLPNAGRGRVLAIGSVVIGLATILDSSTGGTTAWTATLLAAWAILGIGWLTWLLASFREREPSSADRHRWLTALLLPPSIVLLVAVAVQTHAPFRARVAASQSALNALADQAGALAPHELLGGEIPDAGETVNQCVGLLCVDTMYAEGDEVVVRLAGGGRPNYELVRSPEPIPGLKHAVGDWYYQTGSD